MPLYYAERLSRRCGICGRLALFSATVLIVLNLIVGSLLTFWRPYSVAVVEEAVVNISIRCTHRLPINGTSRNGTTGEPFYVHYVKFGSATSLRFMDYLSVVSALRNVQPYRILVHGDNVPTGPYWNLLVKTGLVHHQPRTPTKVVGVHANGNGTEVGFTEHSADMAKLDALIEYGGVAVDFDVYFIRGERIKTILETKESITCYGDENGYNIGFVAGRRGSPLVTAWRRSYEDVYQKDWNFNQAKIGKYLSILYRDTNYVAGFVCNNPHPHNMHGFFKEYGKVKWSDSLAIHTYYRHIQISAEKPEDLYSGSYVNTTNGEMMVSIFEGRDLPEVDPGFQDEIDPLTGMVVGVSSAAVPNSTTITPVVTSTNPTTVTSTAGTVSTANVTTATIAPNITLMVTLPSVSTLSTVNLINVTTAG